MWKPLTVVQEVPEPFCGTDHSCRGDRRWDGKFAEIEEVQKGQGPQLQLRRFVGLEAKLQLG